MNICKRVLEFYNIDAIIAVGYRVNSYEATQFRIWATKTLKDYIFKGFVLDDMRSKRRTSHGTIDLGSRKRVSHRLIVFVLKGIIYILQKGML